MTHDVSLADTGSGVRIAVTRDRARVAASLSRAFADDPALRFIFPHPADRAERLPRFFAMLFDTGALAGMRLTTVDGEAASLWRGPGQARASVARMMLSLWPMWRAFGPALPRALAVSRAIEAHFPAEPFWYLHMLGCDPAAQRRGLGAAVVRDGLDRVCGGGLPTCLETASERNLGFYAAFGFVVMSDWTVPGGGPRFWSLRRG